MTRRRFFAKMGRTLLGGFVALNVPLPQSKAIVHVPPASGKTRVKFHSAITKAIPWNGTAADVYTAILNAQAEATIREVTRRKSYLGAILGKDTGATRRS